MCGNERTVLADRAWMPGLAMSAMPMAFWRAWSSLSELGMWAWPCGLGLFVKPRRESRLASIPAITWSRSFVPKRYDDDGDVSESMRRSVSALAFALASSVTAATSTNPSGGDMRIVTSSLTHVTSLEARGEETPLKGALPMSNGARSDRVDPGRFGLDPTLREDLPYDLSSRWKRLNWTSVLKWRPLYSRAQNRTPLFDVIGYTSRGYKLVSRYVTLGADRRAIM